MVFELPDKSNKEFYWRTRPLGIGLGTTTGGLPIAVDKVTGQCAKDQGIQVGFVLKGFGDDQKRLEVVDGRDASLILEDLERFVNKLPEASR
eukprot:Skav217916  [mRNA]  locus=scaffold795:281272:281547:- [translate_table: standard]